MEDDVTKLALALAVQEEKLKVAMRVQIVLWTVDKFLFLIMAKAILHLLGIGGLF